MQEGGFLNHSLRESQLSNLYPSQKQEHPAPAYQVLLAQGRIWKGSEFPREPSLQLWVLTIQPGYDKLGQEKTDAVYATVEVASRRGFEPLLPG